MVDEMRDNDTNPYNAHPLAFFILAGVLISPLFLVDVFVPNEIVPGVPLAGLGVVCPALAAAILAYCAAGKSGVKSLVWRALDFRKISHKRWWATILLIMPIATIISIVAALLLGQYVPAPHISALSVVALSVGFLLGGMCEELGWSGYATEPLQERWGALCAAITIGLFWSVYHYVALFQVGRSFQWIAWWTLYTVASRVIMVWIFNGTRGSVFAVSLFHATINLSWQLQPVDGSSFDPRITGIVLGVIALAVVGLTRASLGYGGGRTSISAPIA